PAAPGWATTDLASIIPLDLSQPYSEKKADKPIPDKQILVRVEADSTGWQIAARELDFLALLGGPVIRSSVAQRELVPGAAFRAMLAAFAPLGRVESVAGKTVKLVWRAGKLPPRDPALHFAANADLLAPVLRQSDRAGQSRRTTLIEWTFIRLDETDA